LTALIAVATVVAAGLVSPQARASGCSTEYNLFWKMSTGTYGLAYGARNENELKHHALDLSCIGTSYPIAETSHLRLGGVDANWVETGSRENPVGNGGSGAWEAFGEWGLNYTTKSLDFRTYACLVAPAYERWQVVNVPGTNNWNTWLDCEDGAGWRLGWQYTSTGYARGIPMGEGARYGDATTSDAVHRNMQWQDATNTWNYSLGVSCYSDADPTFNGTGVTASRFDIVSSGGTSC
jgi:hypothetical protein